MKSLHAALLCFSFAAGPPAQAQKPVEAYSRIHHHRDGTRTESRKDGNKNEIHELTYNQHDVLSFRRVFMTDSKGRSRRGIIYDGKGNPLGSIEFGYDSKTDQLVEERQFNNQGKLIRRLFYPGSLKIKDRPDLANRFVAFNYDPNNPKAAPVQESKEVRPTRPVESSQDEFEPGIPIGRSAPAANTAPAVTTPANPAANSAGKRRSFLPVRKS